MGRKVSVEKERTPEQAKRLAQHYSKRDLAGAGLQQKLTALGDEALLDEYEFAAFMDKSVQWARNRRVYGGSIPFIKIGTSVRYRVADIKASFKRFEQTASLNVAGV